MMAYEYNHQQFFPQFSQPQQPVQVQVPVAIALSGQPAPQQQPLTRITAAVNTPISYQQQQQQLGLGVGVAAFTDSVQGQPPPQQQQQQQQQTFYPNRLMNNTNGANNSNINPSPSPGVNIYAQPNPPPGAPPPVSSYGGPIAVTAPTTTNMSVSVNGVTTAQIMQAGNLQQQMSHNPYATSPYGRPPQITSSPYQPPSMAPVNQLQQQQPQQPPPQQQVYPPSTPQGFQRQQPQASQPHPVSGLPAPSTPVNQQSQMVQYQKQQSSPATLERDKARIAVLLEINTLLLQQVLTLQKEGKAQYNVEEPQPQLTPGHVPPKRTNYTPEYIDCMRRLQANLAYLATLADRSHKGPSAPAILDFPPQNSKSYHPRLIPLYERARKLFPEAKPRSFYATSSQGPSPISNARSQAMVMAPGQQPIAMNPAMNPAMTSAMGMGIPVPVQMQMQMQMQRPRPMNPLAMNGIPGTTATSMSPNPTTTTF